MTPAKLIWPNDTTSISHDRHVQTFRDMLARRPFQPMKLTLSSGKSFEIRHPEMAMLTRTSILIGVDVAQDGISAEFKIISLLHVASMEPMSSQGA